MALLFPDVSLLPLERYASLFDADELGPMMARIGEWRALLEGRVVWNISSSAVGGGVAEMVRSLLAYARGAGVDARWAVVARDAAVLHADQAAAQRAPRQRRRRLAARPRRARDLRSRSARDNASELLPMVRPGDVVIVHDPQPAAMIAPLAQAGAHVVWRCHIGADEVNDEVDRRLALSRALSARCRGLRLLARRLRAARPAQRAGDSAEHRSVLDEEPAAAGRRRPRHPRAHRHPRGSARTTPPMFAREDGTPGRVDRCAEVLREGGPPPSDTPLVVQVSRWDRLKDPIGVLHGFARIDERGVALVLAGPDVRSVADDPEGAAVYAEVVAAWHALPDDRRRRVHLVSLPAVDVDENAAIVNALQAHASVIVQKSLHEGFGLTVTEAMWKARPVVASAVGGIQDQIRDGTDGLLVGPRDLDAFAGAVALLLDDRPLADRLAAAARARVRERYLGIHSLLRFGALIEALIRRPEEADRRRPSAPASPSA